MRASASTREKWVVGTLLAVLFLVFLISGFELARSFVAPEALSGLIGGEGPAADRCSYLSLASYRASNALLAALCAVAMGLSLPVAAARRRLVWLVPVVALTASFGLWFDWGCRLLGSAA